MYGPLFSVLSIIVEVGVTLTSAVGTAVGITSEILLVFCTVGGCLEFLLFDIKIKEIITINKTTIEIINKYLKRFGLVGVGVGSGVTEVSIGWIGVSGLIVLFMFSINKYYTNFFSPIRGI